MDWFESITDWVRANDTRLWWLAAGSLVFFLLTPPAVVWILVRLPTDYFVKKDRALGSWDERPSLRVGLLVLKNLLGVIVLVSGRRRWCCPARVC